MTPAEFKEARMLAQLTQEQAGEVCYLEGKNRGRTVRRWESGSIPVPLYAAKAIRAASAIDLSLPALLRRQAS